MEKEKENVIELWTKADAGTKVYVIYIITSTPNKLTSQSLKYYPVHGLANWWYDEYVRLCSLLGLNYSTISSYLHSSPFMPGPLSLTPSTGKPGASPIFKSSRLVKLLNYKYIVFPSALGHSPPQSSLLMCPSSKNWVTALSLFYTPEIFSFACFILT